MAEQRTIVITGATDGLGKGLAAELAPTGARLILHGRNQEKGEALLDELRPKATGELEWRLADFASLDDVRYLADSLLDEQKIDALVNNAGIGTSGPREESEDGYELTFQVDYLAPFLLTRRLLPLLRSSSPSRIVNVSSAGQTPIDFDDVMLERHYDGSRAYAQSKLAQVMHTFDLAERLDAVTANALHPATYMPTKIVIHARGSAVSTLEEGTHATERLVVADELVGVSGRYFNGVQEARANAQAYDPDARRALRELSLRLTD